MQTVRLPKHLDDKLISTTSNPLSSATSQCKHSHSGDLHLQDNKAGAFYKECIGQWLLMWRRQSRTLPLTWEPPLHHGWYSGSSARLHSRTGVFTLQEATIRSLQADPDFFRWPWAYECVSSATRCDQLDKRAAQARRRGGSSVSRWAPSSKVRVKSKWPLAASAP